MTPEDPAFQEALPRFQGLFPVTGPHEPRDGICVAYEGAQPLTTADLVADGFSPVPRWLARRPEVPWGAKGVYGVLSGYLRMGRASPSLEEIARETGLYPRHVRRHLKLLKDIGLLQVTRPSRVVSNTYVLMDNTWRSGTRGRPRPLREVVEDLSERSSGTSLSEEENRTEEDLFSYGEEWQGLSLRSRTLLPAGQPSPRDPQQKQGQSSAAIDALRHNQEDKVPEDRMKSAAVIAAEAAARARATQALKDEKRKGRNQQKLEAENKFFPTLRDLEDLWHRETRGVFPKWGKREFGLVGDLLKRSSTPVVEGALVLAARFWPQLFAHIMGPKKAAGTISLAFIHRHAETVLMLGKVWSQHSDESGAIAAIAALGLKLSVASAPSDLPPGFEI